MPDARQGGPASAVVSVSCGCWFGRFQYHFCEAARLLIEKGGEASAGNAMLYGEVEQAVVDHYEVHGVPIARVALLVGDAQRSAKRTRRDFYVK